MTADTKFDLNFYAIDFLNEMAAHFAEIVFTLFPFVVAVCMIALIVNASFGSLVQCARSVSS